MQFRRRGRRKEGEGRGFKLFQDVKWYNLREGGVGWRDREENKTEKDVKWYNLEEGGERRRERGGGWKC